MGLDLISYVSDFFILVGLDGFEFVDFSIETGQRRGRVLQICAQVSLLCVLVLADSFLLLAQFCVEEGDALVVPGFLAKVKDLSFEFGNLKVFIVILGCFL